MIYYRLSYEPSTQNLQLLNLPFYRNFIVFYLYNLNLPIAAHMRRQQPLIIETVQRVTRNPAPSPFTKQNLNYFIL